MKNFTKGNLFQPIKFFSLLVILNFFVSHVFAQNCTVNAGEPQTVCENEVLTLKGTASGVFEAADTLVTWTQISGPSVFIESPNSLTTNVYGIVGGETYVFRISTTCLDGSLIYQDVSNNVLPVSTSYAGEDMTVCPGTYNLSADPVTELNESGGWTIVTPNNGIAIDDPTSATSLITVSGNASGNTRLVWTITNDNGCSSVDTVIITNRGGVTPVTAGPLDTISHCYSATQTSNLNGSYAGSGIDGQFGTWTVVSGPNIPVINNANNNTSGVGNLVEGTYVFQWEVEGSCVNGIAYHTIVVPAPTSDVTDADGTNSTNVYCDAVTSVVLNGTFPAFTNETVLWEKITGPDPVSILNPTNNVTSVEGLDGTSNYSFQYTITNDSTNCTSSATVNIRYADAPTIDITPLRVDLSCGESVANIPYTSTGDGGVSWSIISGPTTASYPIIPTDYNQANGNPLSVPGLTEPGDYVIRLRKVATTGTQCEAVFVDVSVVVSFESALSNAGTDQFLACNVDTTSLAGNEPSVGIGTWSQVSGPNVATIDNLNQYNSPISNLINGTYVFRWVISGGPFCLQNQDDVQVIVANQVPNQAVGGPDQTVCINTPVYLEGSNPILNEWGEWTVFPDDPTIIFADPSNANTTAEGFLANTTYQLIWSIYNACGETHDTLEIITNDVNGPIVADAGADLCLATGTTSFSLSGNDPSPGSGEWIQVNGTGATILTPLSASTDVTVAADGTYYFEWSVITTGCEPTRDTVRVTIAETVTTADAGSDQEICGNTAEMNAVPAAIGNGSWIQIGGAGGVEIDDISSPTAEFTNLEEGVYRFVWLITNEACEESVDTLTLYVSEPPVAAVAGVDIDVCASNTVQMSANSVENGLWSIVSAPNTPSVSDFTAPDAVFGNLIMGTYVFSWTSSGGTFCPSLSDTVIVEVIPQASVTEVRELCEATTEVGLVGNINSIGNWTQISGPPVDSLVKTTENTATAYFSTIGTFEFEYEIPGVGCTTADTTTIILLPPPPVPDAGNDQEYCDASSFTLTGNDPQSSDGEWTLFNGPSSGNFSYSDDSTAVFTPSGNIYGVYVFTWKISNGECENGDQVRVTNFQPPFNADAGDDQHVTCDTLTYMAADTAGIIGDGEWFLIDHSLTSPPPVIVSPVLPDSKITGLGLQSDDSPAIYRFEWVVTNGALCGDIRDTLEITVYEAPSEAIAGNDTSLCAQVSYTLDANPATVGSGKWILVVGPNIPVIADSTLNNTLVSNLIEGSYTFYWETTTAFCSSIDSVIITNFAEPSNPDPMALIEICQFEGLTLTNSVPAVGTGVWSQISGPSATILNSTSNTTQVVGILAGSSYDFRWTVSNGVCAAKSEDVSVTVYEQPEMALAGSNQEFCNTDTTILDGNDPLTASGIWTVESNSSGQPDPVFDDETIYNTTFRGISEGSYVLRWTVFNGVCSTYDEMQIVRYADLSISDPSGGDICVGGSSTLTVEASGGSGTYSYQWQDSIDGGSWANVTAGSGGTTPSYTTSNSLLADTYYYRVIVSECNTVVSNTATVVVYPDATISVQPTGDIICAGSTHAMNVTVDNGVNVTYQWQQSTTGTGAWVNISGETTSSYTTPVLNSTMHYRVRIFDNGSGCADPISSVAHVYVPYIETQPGDATICDGGTNSLSVTMETDGGITYNYQWQDSTVSGTWLNIPGEITSTYNTPVLNTGDYFYRCVITPTNPVCADIITNEVTIAVVSDPQVDTESGDITICAGGTATHSVTVSGGTASSYIYQWQLSTTDCITGFSNILGADEASYTTPVIDVSGDYYYRCVITQTESGCADTSTCKTLTVVDDPVIDIQPVGDTICTDDTHSMSVSVSGGVGMFSYQWQESNDGITWANVAGGTDETTDSYTTDLISTSTFFRAVISQSVSGCNTLYSDTVRVAVPEIISQPVGSDVCLGEVDTLTVFVDGAGSALTYQWQFSDFDCNTGWSDISGATDTFYITSILPESGTRNFRCVVSVSTPACEDLISDCVPISVTGCNPLIGVSNQLVNVENNGDGTYDALFTIRVQNYGGTVLNDIQVTHNLDSAFGAGNYLVEEITSTSFAVNTAYNGSSDTTMLKPAGNTLLPGASTDIVLKVTILSEGSYWLSATGTGVAPDSTVVSDVSQNGSDPDPNQENDPNSYNDPTPVNTSCVNAIADAGPDAEICSGDSYQIVDAEVSNDSSFVWSTSGDGTFNSTSVISPVYTPGTNDITNGTVDLILIANSFGTCPDSVDNMELIINSIILAAPIITDANCDSNESGSVQLSVISGGTAPYTFDLSIGESNSTGLFETLAAGGYIYNVTDATGCSVSGSFEIDDPNELELTVIDEIDETCFSSNNGSATVEASGGTGPYSFSWTGSVTQVSTTANPNTVTGLEAGIYVVTVTDNNGCQEIETIEIEQPSQLNLLLVDLINPDCDNSGQVIVTGEGGVTPYLYTTTSGTAINNIISNLSSGNDTIYITDANGCIDSLIVTLTDIDIIAPTFTCPETDTLYADTDCEVTVPDLVSRVTDEADNCTGTPTVTQSVVAGVTISSDLTVTITATDASGNATSCDVLLVVQDTTPPDAVCKDITLNLDMTGTIHISPEDIDGGSSDNCGLSSLEVDITTFTCLDLGDNSVVLTVTDDAGNTSTCNATVTIEDNIDPILDCPAPVTLIADVNCEALVPDFAGALSSNNCGNATVTQSPVAGTTLNLGETTVTITATDAEGNSSECTTIVTVIDETAPTFTCPETDTLYADTDCEVTVPDLVSRVTDEADNCTATPTVTQSVVAGVTISSDLTVTITATDAAGNATSCDVLLVVQDTTPPDAVCKDITLNLDMTGTIHISPEDIDGGSSDNCGLSSLEVDITTFTCLDLGDNSVVLTVTDDAGNTSTCNAAVTIEDNIDPILDCPSPVTLIADVNCEALVPDFAGALSSNNCGNATVTQSPVAGTTITRGVTIITVTATDDEGNIAECTVDVIVLDETPPSFICSVPISTTSDIGSCDASIDLIAPAIDDNCDSSSVNVVYRVYASDNSVSGFIDVSSNTYLFNVGINQVEWIMTDVSGNVSVCLQEVEILENESPVITCPAGGSFNFENSLDLCGYLVPDLSLDATATDNCNIVSVTHDFYGWANTESLEGAVFPVGSTTVNWTATDASGNTSTCSIDVVVEDTQIPEFVNCPDGDTLIVALFSGVCEGGAVWSTPIANDNCSEVEVTQTAGPESGSELAAGYYTIEYTATDTSDNQATCSFVLHVIDTEGPIVVCPTDFFEKSDPGVCTWDAPVGSLTPLLAISNCPFDVTYEITGTTAATGIDDASGTTFELGTSIVTYTITEPVSNQTWNCSFNVTVYDEEEPIVFCPEDTTVLNDLGLCSATIDLLLPEFTDNCDETVSMYYNVYEPDNSMKGPFSSDNNSFTFKIGISRVDWFVTDAAGNIGTCTQEVTIYESEDPVITCPSQDEYIFNSTPGLCGYIIPDNSLDATATDNCGVQSISHNFGDWAVHSSLEGAVFPVGSTEVTWTAIDNAGNSIECSYTVTVIDNEDPLFVNCPSGVTFTVGLFAGACEGGAIWSIPVALDECSDVTITQTRGPAQGTTLDAGSYVIEYEASDASGNTSECSFTVVVTDTEDPVIVCQPDMVKASDFGTCSWESPVSSLSPLLANSNCPATVTWRVRNPDGTIVSGTDDVSGYTFYLGTSTVYYSITESVSGQDWDCHFTVTVVDEEKPIILCQNEIIAMAPPGECEADVELTSPGFTDNCSDLPSEITYVVYAPDNTMSEETDAENAVYTFMVGINRVEWKVTDEAGNYSVCWQNVWVNADRDTLTPDAGPNSSICEMDSFDAIEAFAPDFAMVEWSTSGTGHFVDPEVVNPVYIPSPSDILDGFVILTISSYTSCESVTDNMVLSITKPPIVFAGNDATICEDDSYQLSGSIINSAFSVLWETTGTGSFNNNEIFNPVYTPGEDDIENGEVILLFKGISASTCNDVLDSITIYIDRQPEITAGEDDSVCEDGTFILEGASIIYGENVIWSTNGTGTFIDDGIINAEYVPSEGDVLNGNVILTVTHTPNGPCNIVSDEMLLTIYKHPVLNAGVGLSTCYGQPVVVNGAIAESYSAIEWTTNGAGTLESSTSLTPIYNPADGESGTIVLTAKVVGEGPCIIDTISDEISITIFEELIADVGKDDTIYYNSTAMLDVIVENGSGSYFYSWQPAALVLDENANYTETIALTNTAEFTVYVTDASTGCRTEDNLVVVVEENADKLVGFYNAFSPNKDGVNDDWQIIGIEKFPENEVLIFNRWGDKVKELQNYNNVTVVWDGTNNREELLPDGTYYYIVNLKNVDSYTGWVHIRSEE